MVGKADWDHFLYANFQTARGMYLLLDTVYVIQEAEWCNLVYRLDGQLWYHNSRTIMKTIGGPSWWTYRATLRKRDTVEAQLRSPTAIIIYSSTESAEWVFQSPYTYGVFPGVFQEFSRWFSGVPIHQYSPVLLTALDWKQELNSRVSFPVSLQLWSFSRCTFNWTSTKSCYKCWSGLGCSKMDSLYFL